jgi:hypothetical protein
MPLPDEGAMRTLVCDVAVRTTASQTEHSIAGRADRLTLADERSLESKATATERDT